MCVSGRSQLPIKSKVCCNHHRHSEDHLKGNLASETRVTGNQGLRAGTGTFPNSLGRRETDTGLVFKERVLCLKQGVEVEIEIWSSGSAPMILRTALATGDSPSRNPGWLAAGATPHTALSLGLHRLGGDSGLTGLPVITSSHYPHPCAAVKPYDPSPQPIAPPSSIPCMNSGRAGDAGSCLWIDDTGNAFPISPRMLKTKNQTSSFGGGG